MKDKKRLLSEISNISDYLQRESAPLAHLLNTMRQDGPEADFIFAPTRITDPIRPVDLS